MKKAPCVELNLIFPLRCKNVYRSACLSGFERRQLSKVFNFLSFSLALRLPADVPQQQPLISPSSTSQMLRNVSSSDFQGSDHHRINFNFMRKIPPGAEASNILVGEVDFLPKTLSAFIRLNSAAIMGDLTEVPVPTRSVDKHKSITLSDN